MRSSKGVFLPPVPAGRLRRGELYRVLRTAVLDGVLSPGDRLPSTRRAASDYGVSRGLMEEVFGQLTDEGFFERAVGRGTFVTSEVARLESREERTTRQRGYLHEPSRRGSALATNAACREPEAPLPFNADIADTSTFPWKLWCRLQARAARELGPATLSFADPRGLPNLRAAIARYLGAVSRHPLHAAAGDRLQQRAAGAECFGGAAAQSWRRGVDRGSMLPGGAGGI